MAREPSEAGDRLRSARNGAGISQTELAQRLDVGQVYVSDVERGKRAPSLEWLHAAALAMGTDPADLDARLASNRGRGDS